MKRKMIVGKCPLCKHYYMEAGHSQTSHHIFPKYWYGKAGVKCFVCHQCHCVEFNKLHPMDTEHNHVWTKKQCLKYWIDFCESKGKNAFRIYPQLRSYQYLLR
jgi:hypothetical protein